MLSDIHFDPFHDPAKFPRLVAAPATEWPAILAAPASPTQAADFAALQKTCGARGVDTPYPLLESSLHAARTQQPAPLFITVSGDLMAHGFDCRFHELTAQYLKGHADIHYEVFAARTIAFVAQQLHRDFPHTPVYLALGNNDSGCKDYDETTGSDFLHDAAQSFAADIPDPPGQAAVLTDFPQLGDYSVPLPAPIAHTRLLVLQDVFESKRAATCSGSSNNDAAKAQISWLRDQLNQARAAHEHVWVMAHIPPGIDSYTTLTHSRDVCSGQSAEMFLGSEDLAKTLADNADVIRLALFAHTHMDEMRVYKSAQGVAPGKLVPSISPVNGNNPAFTLAAVEQATATLKDYAVYSAQTPTSGAGNWDKPVTWALEYRYSTTYKMPDLSGASLDKLTAAMVADKTTETAASQAYQRFYFVSDGGLRSNLKAAAMQFIWPGYACAMTEAQQAGYRTCSCPAPAPASTPAPTK